MQISCQNIAACFENDLAKNPCVKAGVYYSDLLKNIPGGMML